MKRVKKHMEEKEVQQWTYLGSKRRVEFVEVFWLPESERSVKQQRYDKESTRTKQ